MQELEKIKVPAGIKRLKFLCLSREELPEQYRGGDHKTFPLGRLSKHKQHSEVRRNKFKEG